MKLLTPRATLIELLRTLEDARTAWDGRSRGDGPVMMPSAYSEGSYAELERRLAEMREGSWHREWWHLSHRYRWGIKRRRRVPVRRTRLGPEPQLDPHCELLGTGEVNGKTIEVNLYEWSMAVDEGMVARGLTHLLSIMHGGETWRLHLPLSYMYQAMGVPPPGERSSEEPAKVSRVTGSTALSSAQKEDPDKWSTNTSPVSFVP